MSKTNVNEGNDFNYRLLGRLQSDCEYFLGAGNGNANRLWAGSVKEQIAKMKELWNGFPVDEKPEWCTMEQIEEYEKQMLAMNESTTNVKHDRLPTIEQLQKLHESKVFENAQGVKELLEKSPDNPIIIVVNEHSEDGDDEMIIELKREDIDNYVDALKKAESGEKFWPVPEYAKEIDRVPSGAQPIEIEWDSIEGEMTIGDIEIYDIF